MARRKRSRNPPKTNERVIDVTLEDINLLLNKWERMTVRESTFFQTWSWAAEAANILTVFANRTIETKSEDV